MKSSKVKLLLIPLAFCIVMLVLLKPASDTSVIAEKAVELLYDFENAEDLNSNMLELQNLCTKEVYANLTIDNEERLLSTYLKFVDGKCSVLVERVTPNYVVYSLVSDYVSSDRKFIFIYEIHEDKISYVKEAELIDFIAR